MALRLIGSLLFGREIRCPFGEHVEHGPQHKAGQRTQWAAVQESEETAYPLHVVCCFDRVVRNVYLFLFYQPLYLVEFVECLDGREVVDVEV